MTFSVSRHAALTSLALAIAAPAAQAQSTLSTVLVTATRSPQSASDVLSDNVVIGADEIARSGAVSLSELLQKQRGIEVTRNGGPGTVSSVFIRGAGNKQNIVLVDGVRIGSATTGEANWSALPLSAIDHIEIVYGPLSTLYGADAIGAVVQIFTRHGAGAPRLGAAVGAGSDAARSYEASISGATGGEHSFSYALSAGKEKSAGFSALLPTASKTKYNADDDGYDKESASGRFALELARGHEIGLQFLHSRLDAQYDNGPGYDARNLKKLENLAFFSKNTFLPKWTSQFQVAEARDLQGTDAGPKASDKSQYNTTQTDFSWQNDILLGADTLQVLLDHRKEESIARERSTNSVAASYNLKRERHLASVSVRNDDSSQYGSNTTGALGYGYRVTNALRASASIGTSFRAPTFNELYDPDVGVAANRPEKGRNAETGLYFDDGVTQLSAVYYRNRLTDLLVLTKPCPVEPAKHERYGCAYNVNHALLEGISLSGRRQFGPLALSGNLDLQDPRDETTGKSLERRARRHANVAAEYGAGALKGGAELQLSGQRFDKADNKDVLGGYGLLNLYASWQAAPDWSLLLRWNNVANKQYELVRTYATAGSGVFLGLRYGM